MNEFQIYNQCLNVKVKQSTRYCQLQTQKKSFLTKIEGFRVKMFLNDILTQNLINIGAISEKIGQCCTYKVGKRIS